MVSCDSATPAVGEDHPAFKLRIGTQEEKAILSRLLPTVSPNDQTVQILQQSYPKDKRWREFRNDYRYIYVVQWMYQCRGYIKLGGEHFDVDLFEIELFNLVSPPPIDDLSLLLHKMRLALINRVHGKKAESLALFEPLFRRYFGNETPLGAAQDLEDETLQAETLFEDLYIDEKIDVLFTLIFKVTQYADFREYLERNKIAPEFARATVLFRGIEPKQRSKLEDYLLTFDDTAMYKRTMVVPPLDIPAKRKLSPEDPEEAFGEDAFDAKSIKYELIYKDIYSLDAFIEELKEFRNYKKNRLLLEVIKKPAAISNVFDYEIQKRRILMSRRKENEMARLLADRKKSSRLEAKQKQRVEEEQAKKLKELKELLYTTSRRSQRNYNILENKIKSDFTAGLSRQERLKLRKGTSTFEELPPDWPNGPPAIFSRTREMVLGEPFDVLEAAEAANALEDVEVFRSNEGVEANCVLDEMEATDAMEKTALPFLDEQIELATSNGTEQVVLVVEARGEPSSEKNGQ